MIEVGSSDSPPSLKSNLELFEALSVHRGKTIRIEDEVTINGPTKVTVGELIWIELGHYAPQLVVHLGKPSLTSRHSSSLKNPLEELNISNQIIKVLLDGQWHTLHMPHYLIERGY